MFDLEKAIARWRQQMLAAGIKTPVPLEELESHLRDEIDQLSNAGQSQAEAFEAAVRTIGLAPVVLGEFKKLADPKAALRWRFLEIGLGAFASVVPLGLGFQLLYAPARPAADLTPGNKLSGLLALLTFAALAWGGRLGYKLFPAAHIKRTKMMAFIVLMTLWWVIFMNGIVPYLDLTMGQLFTAMLWAFIMPAGAVIGCCWGMEAAIQKQNDG